MTEQQSSSIRFSCPSCGGRVKVPPGQAGQKCRCPRCDAEVIAPGAAPENRRSLGPIDDDDFFSSADSLPRQQAARPLITLDDEFATPLGPPQAPRLPEAELAESPEVASDAESLDFAPVSVDPDEAIELPLSIDDAPVSPSRIDADDSPGNGGPSATEADAPARRKARQTQQFGVECGLCGTRIYATLDQVGRELTCPDCHSKIPIRAPKVSKKSTQPPPPPPDGDSDTFRLSEPIERPASDYVARAGQTLAGATDAASGAAASGEPAERRSAKSGAASGSNIIAEHARNVLAKAKAEIEEAEKTKAKLPDRPFVTGVISFLFDLSAVTRWLVLTFLLQGMLSLLALILGGHMAGVLLTMPVAVCSFFFLWTASVCYQAILQDTANGRDVVEQWPGVNFLDWMGEAFYVVNALFASATPGILFGVILACGGVPRSSGVLFGLVTFVALFPVFLLSMVEEGSPLSIASSPVWRSLLFARSLWVRFYLLSLGTVFAALVGISLAVVALASTNPAIGFVLCGVAAAFAVAATMVYFRLLGRLAWCLSELDRQTPRAEKSSDTAAGERGT